MGSWNETVSKIMGKAKEGFRRSEVTGVYASVTDSLIKRGKLVATPIPNGDWIVNLP